MEQLFKKGDFVRYDLPEVPRAVVEAVVRRAHRDGTSTVEARHVFRNGLREGGYLGFAYRMHNGDLRAA